MGSCHTKHIQLLLNEPEKTELIVYNLLTYFLSQQRKPRSNLINLELLMRNCWILEEFEESLKLIKLFPKCTSVLTIRSIYVYSTGINIRWHLYSHFLTLHYLLYFTKTILWSNIIEWNIIRWVYWIDRYSWMSIKFKILTITFFNYHK